MSIARHIKAGLILLLSLLTAAIILPAAAIAAPTQEITVKVNGQVVALDTEPVIMNGRTLVPLRGVFEKLGDQVDWLPATREAVINGNGHVVKVTSGSNVATVDDKTVTMDVQAMVVTGRMMVPLRFLSESMGVKAIWVGSTSTVEILDMNKLTPEQRQLLECFDSLKDAHQANQERDETTEVTGPDSQPLDITVEYTSKVAINNNDSHLWMQVTSSEDSTDAAQEPSAIEVIQKSGQLYARSGNDPWQAVDQDELDIPPVIAGDWDEQFLRYYNIPFKVQNDVVMDGQKTTEYSFTIDQKTFADTLKSLAILPSAGDAQDPELLNTLKNITDGNGSKNLFLNSENRIIHDSTSISMDFQPPTTDQDQGGDNGDQNVPDLTKVSKTINIETSFDYTGQPEPIIVPVGVFPDV